MIVLAIGYVESIDQANGSVKEKGRCVEREAILESFFCMGRSFFCDALKQKKPATRVVLQSFIFIT
jgi:hypothetical protein